MNTDTFTTTLRIPLRLRAQLDIARARRAEKTGKRPTMREMLEEAVRRFVAAERNQH
jgi:hypothetical protein